MLKQALFLSGVSTCFAITTFAVDDAAKSNNEFCFRLIEKAGTKENQIFSPFSIWSALAMTSAGAEAETLKQMSKVLSLPADGSDDLVSGWSGRLQKAGGVKMKIANRLWGRKGLPFRAEFLKLTDKHYGAGLESMDFPGDPDGSRQQINRWVSDNTEGKIKDLLSPGTIQSYNFQKVSAVLADYGFATIRLSDDGQGADFIAQHKDGKNFLKVQLKGRLSFYKKYQGKDLHICFPHGAGWFLFPHDEVLEQALKLHAFGETKSWMDAHGYSFPGVPKELLPLLEPYHLRDDSGLPASS